MSETPRTDNHTIGTSVDVIFARQLETELADKEKRLAEARAEIERLKSEHEDSLRRAKDNAVSLSGAVTEYAGELLVKDRLIEQMREALKALRKYPNTYIATGQGGGIAENDLAMCDAALAAERGVK